MAREAQTTTISTVAEHGGVSAATVSRVMNGRFHGSADIAERVRASAAALSYSPNQRARSFASGQTKAIAFLVPDLANPVFQATLKGLSDAASAAGYRVLVADSAGSAQDEPLLAEDIRHRADALVLCAPRMPDDVLRRVTEELSPVVLLNRTSSSVSVPTVAADSRAGFESLAQHLYGLGHRRLAYVEGPDEIANGSRRSGLRDFCAAHPDVSIERIPGGASIESGLASVDAVLEAGSTAVLAFNDLVAMGVVHGLIERGVSVPGDISVTGFDDVLVSRFLLPSLTTASVPYPALGRLAWIRMQALIDGETPEHDVLIQPRIEERKSTAAPKSA